MEISKLQLEGIEGQVREIVKETMNLCILSAANDILQIVEAVRVGIHE
jgi:hypothetical protein